MRLPSLSIVIVNWNTKNQLRDCIESIGKAKKDGFFLRDVIIVDNASTDGSLEGQDSLSLPLHIIRNSENRGFAAACNQGAEVCDADYLLFLNPDTKLFADSLSVPVAFMEDTANQDVGICGIQLVDEQGRVARTCANFPSLGRFAAQSTGIDKIPGLRGAGVHMADWDHLETREVDQVIGAFYFTRQELFAAVQGFDERFFVYFEEVDLSYRTAHSGWKSVYLTEAQAFHLGGGTSQQVKARRLFYSLQSRLLYGFKHFPHWQASILVVITLLIEPLSRTLFSLLRGGVQDMRNTWRGYGMLYRGVPRILKGQK